MHGEKYSDLIFTVYLNSTTAQVSGCPLTDSVLPKAIHAMSDKKYRQVAGHLRNVPERLISSRSNQLGKEDVEWCHLWNKWLQCKTEMLLTWIIKHFSLFRFLNGKKKRERLNKHGKTGHVKAR